MAKILENHQLSRDFYLMKLLHPGGGAMGQFYMVRGWKNYPLLSRPISIFDADAATISLLYKVVGEGTLLLSGLRSGDEIALHGPYGTPFPSVSGKTALVGGGVGIAPLHLAAKTLQQQGADRVDVYLGFSDVPLLQKEFEAVSHNLYSYVGGFVTDHVDPAFYNQVFTCGPDPMMRVLYEKCRASGVNLYVSMENRMACGLGACLVCSCKTGGGNRKVCKDGPVFPAEEVYFDA